MRHAPIPRQHLLRHLLRLHLHLATRVELQVREATDVIGEPRAEEVGGADARVGVGGVGDWGGGAWGGDDEAGWVTDFGVRVRGSGGGEGVLVGDFALWSAVGERGLGDGLEEELFLDAFADGDGFFRVGDVPDFRVVGCGGLG